MQENKTKDIEVTAIGKARISFLPKCEERVCCSMLPELTREMCYELIDRIIIGGHPKHTGKEREIDIVYKIDIASVLRDKLNK